MHYFVCCPNTVRTVCSCLAMFEHCSDSGQTCHTFISMCSNRVQTARHAVVCCSNITRCFACCPNTVRTLFGHVIHLFPCVRTVWSCLAMFEHFEQCSNCVLMPTTCGKSIPFLFYFPLSCLFVYSHPRLPASARMPIRNMSTCPDQ